MPTPHPSPHPPPPQKKFKIQVVKKRIGHFRVPKTPTFKISLGAQPFLWKWVLFAWEWKMISLSKAEHLPLFRNRGPGDLGNGLLGSNFFTELSSFCWLTHLKDVTLRDIYKPKKRAGFIEIDYVWVYSWQTSPKTKFFITVFLKKNKLSVNSEKSVLAHVFVFCCLIYYFVGN